MVVFGSGGFGREERGEREGRREGGRGRAVVGSGFLEVVFGRWFWKVVLPVGFGVFWGAFFCGFWFWFVGFFLASLNFFFCHSFFWGVIGFFFFGRLSGVGGWVVVFFRHCFLGGGDRGGEEGSFFVSCHRFLSFCLGVLGSLGLSLSFFFVIVWSSCTMRACSVPVRTAERAVVVRVHGAVMPRNTAQVLLQVMCPWVSTWA